MRCIPLSAAAAFAAASVMAPIVVSAAECTDEEVEGMNGYDLSPLLDACPTVFAAEPKVPDPSKPETITKESLKEMSACKTERCILELTKYADWMFDCTRGGLNDKRVLFATIAVCKAFNGGDVTIPMVADMFKEVAENSSEALAHDLTEGSDDGTSTAGITIPVVSSSKSPTRSAVRT